MVDQLDVGARFTAMECHPQGVEDEVCAHVSGELPADDHPAVGVEDEGEEDESVPAAQVGEVGDPELVRAVDGEVALHEVRPPLRLRVGPGRAPRLAAPLRTDDPVAPHQPLYLATRHLLAGAAKRLPHPPIAVGVVVGRVQLPDPAEQPLVFDRPLGAATLASFVVRGHRHAQRGADRLDPVAAAMLVDVAAHFGRSGSSSLAKNTLADFKISFARRSS